MTSSHVSRNISTSSFLDPLPNSIIYSLLIFVQRFLFFLSSFLKARFSLTRRNRWRRQEERGYHQGNHPVYNARHSRRRSNPFLRVPVSTRVQWRHFVLMAVKFRQVQSLFFLSFFESAPPGSSKQIVRRVIGASNTGIMRSDAVNNVIFVHINTANIICKSPLWCLVHSSAPRRFHCLTQRTARAPGLKWNLMIQCGFHVYSPLSDIYTSSATGWA